MRSTMAYMAVLVAIGLCWAPATAASAKSKGKSCAKAEALLLATGEGDRDGDGLSDCRERRQLHTLMDDADSDGDRLPDGYEVAERCDPLDPDSDDDGIEDGEDETPGIPTQEVEAFLDALTCPALGVPGSITALGISAALDDHTEFDDTSCEELALHLATSASTFVEIEIIEDSTGALTATEVELEDDDDEDHRGGDEEDDD